MCRHTRERSWTRLNVGLLLLTLGTLFPVGVLQTWVSFKEGFWVARDASFFMKQAPDGFVLQEPPHHQAEERDGLHGREDFVQFIGTVRVIPDMIIILLG